MRKYVNIGYEYRKFPLYTYSFKIFDYTLLVDLIKRKYRKNIYHSNFWEVNHFKPK